MHIHFSLFLIMINFIKAKMENPLIIPNKIVNLLLILLTSLLMSGPYFPDFPAHIIPYPHVLLYYFLFYFLGSRYILLNQSTDFKFGKYSLVSLIISLIALQVWENNLFSHTIYEMKIINILNFKTLSKHFVDETFI